MAAWECGLTLGFENAKAWTPRIALGIAVLAASGHLAPRERLFRCSDLFRSNTGRANPSRPKRRPPQLTRTWAERNARQEPDNPFQVQCGGRQMGLNAIGHQPQIATASKAMPQLALAELALDLVPFFKALRILWRGEQGLPHLVLPSSGCGRRAAGRPNVCPPAASVRADPYHRSSSRPCRCRRPPRRPHRGPTDLTNAPFRRIFKFRFWSGESRFRRLKSSELKRFLFPRPFPPPRTVSSFPSFPPGM